MHRHLVAVEVGIECRANQGVNSNRFAFDQNGLKRLNTQSVQRRCTVQQNRVVLNDFLEDLIHLRALALHNLLRAFDRLGNALFDQLVNDERLEQLDGHRLWQSALM